MEFPGISVSEKINEQMNGCEAVISAESPKVKVLIVPANEELMIAREVAAFSKLK